MKKNGIPAKAKAPTKRPKMPSPRGSIRDMAQMEPDGDERMGGMPGGAGDIISQLVQALIQKGIPQEQIPAAIEQLLGMAGGPGGAPGGGPPPNAMAMMR